MAVQIARTHSAETYADPTREIIPSTPPKRRLSFYRRLLLTFHRLVLDRIDAGPERISTAGEIPPGAIPAFGANQTLSNGYRPSPRSLIRWILDLLPEPPERLVFMDLGAGRGRVLLEAARLPFRRIVGVEFAERLHEDAAMNLRHWPRSLMACRDVDLLLDDAASVELPAADLVVYMFDPFAERLMTRIAARLAEHGRRHTVHIVIVDPRSARVFRESTAFRALKLPAKSRRRLALFSPYRVEIFRAGAAAGA